MEEKAPEVPYEHPELVLTNKTRTQLFKEMDELEATMGEKNPLKIVRAFDGTQNTYISIQKIRDEIKRQKTENPKLRIIKPTKFKGNKSKKEKKQEKKIRRAAKLLQANK